MMMIWSNILLFRFIGTFSLSLLLNRYRTHAISLQEQVGQYHNINHHSIITLLATEVLSSLPSGAAGPVS
jgi:hypothetical protein